VTDTAPNLSVVVPTRAGWPEYEPVFRHQRREVESVGGELLVLDGSGRPAPPEAAIGSNTRWLSHPGVSVLGLRALGYPLAKAPIVAVSEDHTRVPIGWAAAILECHREHPEAAAIGGSSLNGDTTSYPEWAAFVCGHDREMAPLGSARRVNVIGVTNVSYKREALALLRPLPGIGVNDAVFQRDLARAGKTLLVDDRISVVHEQHMNFRQATYLFFQAGRMGAGARRQRMTLREAGRIAITPAAPLILTARLGLWMAQRRRERLRYIAELPMIAWLYGARSAGELVGYARGAGHSALLLH
jgi:hypothetical protein